MLRIVGDINFADGYFDTGIGVGARLKSNANPFSGLQINDSDYWIGNFECVASSSSSQSGFQSQCFRIDPEMLRHFKHLNLYGVANNHVMQHGESAYKEMIGVIHSLGVDYVGSKDKHIHRFTHQGKRVGVIAFCQRPDNFTSTPLYWSSPEYMELESDIRSLSDVDYRIAIVHWGNEFIDYPYKDQKQVAHFLIDSGIDLVVGMHPHVLQGQEFYHNGMIFYSLGNCVFKMAWEPTRYSIVIKVDLSKEKPEVTYDYIYINPKTYFPSYIKEVPKSYSVPSLTKKVSTDIENELYYSEVFTRTKEYRKANRIVFLQDIRRLSFRNSFQMIIDYFKRRR